MKKSEEMRAKAAAFTKLAEQYENLERSELQMSGQPAPEVSTAPVSAKPSSAKPSAKPAKPKAQSLPPRKIPKDQIYDKIYLFIPNGEDNAISAVDIAAKIGENKVWVSRAIAEMVKDDDNPCKQVGQKRGARYYK